MPTASERAQLLERFRPHIGYDSREEYFATSPDVMVEMVSDEGCTVLKRAHGEVLAAADPARHGGVPKLTLALLMDAYSGKKYGDSGSDVQIGDHLDAPKVPAAQAFTKDVLYGHVADARDGGWWVQYWFFYYYNEVPESGGVLTHIADHIPVGDGQSAGTLYYDRHQGDWEMIQLGVAPNGNTLTAISCSQHNHSQTYLASSDGAFPGTVMFAPGEPGHAVVYPARGTHATYFAPGDNKNALINNEDHNNGGGRGGSGKLISPEILDFADPGCAWIAWPGAWGASRASAGGLGGSPTGPMYQGKWTNPEKVFKLGLSHFHMTARAP